jgi:hypothetical protein
MQYTKATKSFCEWFRGETTKTRTSCQEASQVRAAILSRAQTGVCPVMPAVLGLTVTFLDAFLLDDAPASFVGGDNGVRVVFRLGAKLCVRRVIATGKPPKTA